MFVVGEVVAPINADTRPFQRGLNSAHSMGSTFITKIGSTFQSFGRTMANFGANLTKYVTVPLAGAAVAVFKFGKDFEAELSKVVGLVGVSRDQVDAWGKDILELAPELGKAPRELADALFFVTSAGIRGAEAMEVLEMAGKASAAGLGETKTIADLVTSAMNAYGKENLSAAQATDIVTAAVREGKAEAAELAATMGAVLPLASEMGVTFDQVAATQAAMTKTGTDAAEAATQLKGIMAGLIKPSKQAEGQLAKMGTSSSDLRKKIREEGLLSALMELKELTNKYGEEAMARVFPNIRALMGVLDLMGSNLDSNIETFDKVANSTGILDDAFEAASETIDFKWNQSLAQLQSTAIKVFDVIKAFLIPVFEKLNDVMKFIGDKFSKMPGWAQKAILGFLGIAGIVGPAIGGLGIIIGTIAGVIAAVGAAFTTLSGVIAAVGLPALGAIAAVTPIIVVYFGAIIGVIASVIASFVNLYRNNEEFREKVISTWNKIKDAAKEIFAELKDTFFFILDKIKEFWAEHGDEIMKIAENTWYIILGIIENVVYLIRDTIKVVCDLIEGDWESAWEGIKDIVSKVLDKIITIAAGLLDVLKTKISEKLDDIKDSIKEKLNEWRESFREFILNLPDTIKNGLNTLKENFNRKLIEIKLNINNELAEWKILILDWFEELPNNIVNALIGWKEAIVKWMIEQNEENKRQFSEWGNSIRTWFEETREKIKTKFSEWGESIRTWFAEAPEKIKTGLAKWWETMQTWFINTKEKIKEKLEGWWQSIKNWFSNLANKKEIKNAGKNMIKKLSDGTKDQKDDFSEKLGKLIVDVAAFALQFAFIALLSTGREIIKRILKGIKSINLKQAGKNLIDDLIAGINSKLGELGQAASRAAQKVRNFFPFSPAKEGPLMDLDKVDFAGPIKMSLDKAAAVIDDSFLSNLSLDVTGIGGGITTNNNNSGFNFYGDMHFEGVRDMDDFLTKMKNVVQKQTGRRF
jgi:TP901 family phage tail tape measure protein